MKSSTATDARRVRRRSRWVLLGIGVGVVAAGLALRQVPGAFGDFSGGILYAALIFVLVALVTPAASAVRIGVWAFAVCALIELVQLTGLPSALAVVFPPARLVFGTTFVATDLLAYAIGAAAAVIADHLLRHRPAR